MEISVTNYKRYEKNTLQAFVDLEIVDIGLTIKGCTVHQKSSSTWIGFPGREYKDSEGKTQWANILQFSKEKGDEFKSKTIEAIRNYVIAEKEGTANEPSSSIPF